MGEDLMNIAMGSEKLLANKPDEPIISEIFGKDAETDGLWDFYIQTMDKEDQTEAYKEVINNLTSFLKFQENASVWINAKKELERFRKLEYSKLTKEEKEQIAAMQVPGKSDRTAINALEYEELTDEQKNLVYLSPEYFLDSQTTDKLVYIYSYRNFPPVKKSVHKYGLICVHKGRCEMGDFEQAANEAILSVLESWKQKEDQKTQRETFKNAVQSKIKRNCQALLEKTAPGFTSDWRHYIIKKTIEDIEKEEVVMYCSQDKDDILTELMETINKRLRHEKEYKLKVIKAVLKEREQRFGEVSLEQQFDTTGDMRLSGFNYDNSGILESPEELVIRQIEYETFINSIQSAKDRDIIKLMEYGYRSNEIGQLEGLTGVAVRQRLTRIRKKLKGRINERDREQ